MLAIPVEVNIVLNLHQRKCIALREVIAGHQMESQVLLFDLLHVVEGNY